MGAGASVPDEITFEQAKSLAGEKWDEKLTALWCVLASETPPPARKATVRSRFTDAGGLPPPCPFSPQEPNPLQSSTGTKLKHKLVLFPQTCYLALVPCLELH